MNNSKYQKLANQYVETHGLFEAVKDGIVKLGKEPNSSDNYELTELGKKIFSKLIESPLAAK